MSASAGRNSLVSDAALLGIKFGEHATYNSSHAEPDAEQLCRAQGIYRETIKGHEPRNYLGTTGKWP